MKDRFLVKIPLDIEDLTKGYREVKFKTYKDLAEFLGTSTHTVKAILEGRIKFANDQTKHLEDVKIEILEDKPSAKTPEDRKKYLHSLLEKVGN